VENQSRASNDGAARELVRLAAILRQSSDVVVVLDDAGCMTYVSPGVDRLLGWSAEDLIGRSALDLVHPDDLAVAVEGLGRTGTGPPVRLRLGAKDGSWIPVDGRSDTLAPDPDAGGIVISIRDDFDRAAIEETLRRERRFLRAILQELEAGIAAYGPDGQLQMINRAARDFFGMADRAVGADRWADEYQLFDGNGITPLADYDTPVQRALRGEVVEPVEMVVVPRVGSRRVLWTSGRPIYDEEGNRIGAVAAMHDITRQKEAEARLQHLAMHDPLTGLPNRLLLLERLGQALDNDHRQHVAVIFLDIDRFKVVNDSLGHGAGDHLLAQVGARLESTVRPTDTVARLGGDEFVVLCPNVAGRADAVRVAERIAAAVHAPCRLGEQEVRVTASIGIALCPPSSAGAGLAAPLPEALVRDADTAMYRAKDLGRARYEIFDEAARSVVVHRLEVEQQLTRAIERGWLRALYQPVFDGFSGDLTGVEALVRYEDPARGLVAPDEFISVAEDTGLITAIDSWMLIRACMDASSWPPAPSGPLRVGVNVSARQLRRPDLVDIVMAALRSSGLPPERLAVEITETALGEATPAVIATIQRLRDVGIHVGADDFGTGYSSLAHLKRFPLDFVKVDQSFVAGLGIDREDTTIVDAVIRLGHALELTVIAEGVETSEQLDMLRSFGCDSFQGFFRSPPLASEEIAGLLVSPPARR
jgi:diguanylate cyclase (GGDEF)-like protein/PAS domain S-box-containing protein